MGKKKFWLIAATILSLALVAGVITNLSEFKKGLKGATGSTDALLSVSTVDGTDGKWYRSAGDAYDYPMTPEKTPEQWKSMLSGADRIAAQQIPEVMLKTISTAGLVESVMNYPFARSYSNFSENYIAGMEAVMSGLNGYEELLMRKDAATELLRFYLSINADTLCTHVETSRLVFGYIELIIARDTFVDQMTSGERIALIKAVMKNVYLKDPYYGNSQISSRSSVMLLGRLLVKESAGFREQLDTDELMKTLISSGKMDHNIEVQFNYRKYITDTIEPIVAAMK